MKSFILAAGLGTRLKPYTDTMPKPMVPLLDKPLIGHILDRLIEAGVAETWVNLHHKADILREYFKTRNDIKIHESYEEELLETGGGAYKILDMFEDKPFMMINGDAFWQDTAEYFLLPSLIKNFNQNEMDILIALYPRELMKLTESVGDYHLNAQQKAHRSLDKNGNYMFAGVRICHPRVFEKTPPILKGSKFSFLKMMDEAEALQKLGGFVYKGEWHHISTPEDLKNVETNLQKNALKYG